MTNSKQYSLEDRTLDFAKMIIRLSKELPSNTVNFKLIDQIIRSAGSIGANYREANKNFEQQILNLIDECQQLRNILSSIITKSTKNV